MSYREIFVQVYHRSVTPLDEYLERHRNVTNVASYLVLFGACLDDLLESMDRETARMIERNPSDEIEIKTQATAVYKKYVDTYKPNQNWN
jgi:hypothetical protein